MRQHRPALANRAALQEALEAGVANHIFLQWTNLDGVQDEASLAKDVARLTEARLLTPEHAALVDINAIARFWASATGRDILSTKDAVRREIPFTLRLDAGAAKDLALANTLPPGEFIVVQGVIDLAVMLRDEIWILDFKTDQVAPNAVTERAAEYGLQLRLYALAMERIFNRKVTHRWLHFLKANQTLEVPARAE
jgi:ATP-dependent helicase/nuclease subunit A